MHALKSLKYVWVLVLFVGILSGVGRTVAAQQSSAASGEFLVGDKIDLTVETPTSIHDVFVVHEGLYITVPNVGDISVKGVRRADIQSYMKSQLSKYFRDPVVKAVALIRINVSGAVGRPGFYTVQADQLLSDVIMTAGGPGQTTDLNNTVVLRSGKEVVDKKSFADALAGGRTLNDLGIGSGDEIAVGDKPKRNVLTYLQFASASLAIMIAIITLKNHH